MALSAGAVPELSLTLRRSSVNPLMFVIRMLSVPEFVMFM